MQVLARVARRALCSARLCGLCARCVPAL